MTEHRWKIIGPVLANDQFLGWFVRLAECEEDDDVDRLRPYSVGAKATASSVEEQINFNEAEVMSSLPFLPHHSGEKIFILYSYFRQSVLCVPPFNKMRK